MEKYLGILPKGIITPSFIEMATAVTQGAMVTDADGHGLVSVGVCVYWYTSMATFAKFHQLLLSLSCNESLSF
jgi:hypothetical protein